MIVCFWRVFISQGGATKKKQHIHTMNSLKHNKFCVKTEPYIAITIILMGNVNAGQQFPYAEPVFVFAAVEGDWDAH